jgi:hypothetical protein
MSWSYTTRSNNLQVDRSPLRIPYPYICVYSRDKCRDVHTGTNFNICCSELISQQQGPCCFPVWTSEPDSVLTCDSLRLFMLAQPTYQAKSTQQGDFNAEFCVFPHSAIPVIFGHAADVRPQQALTSWEL